MHLNKVKSTPGLVWLARPYTTGDYMGQSCSYVAEYTMTCWHGVLATKASAMGGTTHSPSPPSMPTPTYLLPLAPSEFLPEVFCCAGAIPESSQALLSS